MVEKFKTRMEELSSDLDGWWWVVAVIAVILGSYFAWGI